MSAIMNLIKEAIARAFNSIMAKYTRKLWNVAIGIASFDLNISNRFCDETIGEHLNDTIASYGYKKTSRVIRMLIICKNGTQYKAIINSYRL